MNNILFCTSLVTEGTLMDDYLAGALGFYDLKTLELTDNVSGKDFGIVGTSLLNEAEAIVNIPDIHLLNVVSATIPSNVEYNITIAAAELEEPSTDTSDVELIILHKNAAPNGDWRQFITIPYADFNGDTDTLLDIITAKLEDLSKKGKLEGATIDTTNGLKLYLSNTEQYEVITKSKLLTISDPSGYKPVVSPAKIVDLIDKNTASWGIWHREEDDDWFKAITSKVVSNEFNNVISIRYVTSRKASITHDELVYNTLHILTNDEVISEAIMAMLKTNNDSSAQGGNKNIKFNIYDDHEEIVIAGYYQATGGVHIVNDTKYYEWFDRNNNHYAYTLNANPEVNDIAYATTNNVTDMSAFGVVHEIIKTL